MLALVATLLVAVCPAAAHAKTIKVDWREQTTVAGGAIKFRVTKIVATTRAWTVTATIQNATDSGLALEPRGRPFQLPPPRPLWTNGMALIESHRVYSVNIGGRHVEWWHAIRW